MTVSALIEPAALAARLADDNLVIFDASWHMPAAARSGRAEYEAAHIPGALFFDIDAISDRATDLPHMLPSESDFAAAMCAAGVGNDSDIVVYDAHGLFSAARAWWMLRAFGYERVSVLNGGLPAWRAAGLPLSSDAEEAKKDASFVARLQPTKLRSKRQVTDNLITRREQIVDARSAPRFSGSVAEPRPGLRSGRIPGSFNVPYTDLLDDEGIRLRSSAEIAAIFQNAGADPSRPITTSCGSGVTACVLTLALSVAGFPDVAVYDGSWAEWGADHAAPIEAD
ncbi:MAG: 3-mercaptopyruvate sulfurtransferase [Amphiplicatus sp.]|nr:3-mercaptopyruvate sulfurtransferase [Amphiplicatus sp.]